MKFWEIVHNNAQFGGAGGVGKNEAASPKLAEIGASARLRVID